MPKLIILLLLGLIQGNTFESSSSVKIEPTDKWTVIGKETIMVQGKPIELTIWVKKKINFFAFNIFLIIGTIAAFNPSTPSSKRWN